MKKVFFFILISCTAAFTYAQSGSFLLYSFKGNVSVIENNVESKAKIGKMMDSKASIKLAAGSSVTLICNEAAMFSIDKSGTYAMSKFGDSCKVSSSSVTSNYVKYVWAQMTKNSGSPGSNRKAYMNTVGATSRGGVNNVWIDPRLDSVNFSSGNIPLSWKSYAEANEFEFFLFATDDNTAKPLFKKTVTKLKIPIADFIKQLKPGNTYYWTAAVKGEENSDLKVFRYVSKEDLDALCESFKTIGVANESAAEQAYRMGFMLEDAHYLAEAYTYYTKAAGLDSTNVLYRSTLMSFKKDYEIK